MTIKIVTLNIWLGGLLQEEYLSFLEAQDADLVLLQEVNNGTDPTLKPQYRTMQILKERLGYPHEAFAAEYRNMDDADGKSQVGNATAAVDMMFVSPNIEVLKHDCPDVDVSDHLPLTATLKIA